MDRNQAEEISRAADEFAAAVREYSRAAEHLAESQGGLERIAQAFYLLYFPRLGEEGDPRRPLLFSYVGAGGLDEEDAAKLAWDVVHDSRVPGEEVDKITRWPAPSPEEVRGRREARKRQES